MSNLTIEVLHKYFDGEMAVAKPATSCAYKHFLVYERMVKHDLPLALVLEVDMFFYQNWDEVFPRVIQEVQTRDLANFIISLEDSSLKYPKGSERKPGRLTYPAIAGRNTGAYLIDISAAKNILQQLKNRKCSIPIGIYQNRVSQAGHFSFFWAHPPVVVQGTATGVFATSIAGHKSSMARRLTFRLERMYKRIISRLK